MNIHGVTDANSFRKTEGQIRAYLAATLQRSARRNA